MLAYSKASAKDFSDYGSFFRTETDADGRFRIPFGAIYLTARSPA